MPESLRKHSRNTTKETEDSEWSHLLDMLFAGNKDGKSLLLLVQSQQWEHLAWKWMTAGIEN